MKIGVANVVDITPPGTFTTDDGTKGNAWIYHLIHDGIPDAYYLALTKINLEVKA
jgi:hypothetical protein